MIQKWKGTDTVQTLMIWILIHQLNPVSQVGSAFFVFRAEFIMAGIIVLIIYCLLPDLGKIGENISTWKFGGKFDAFA